MSSSTFYKASLTRKSVLSTSCKASLTRKSVLSTSCKLSLYNDKKSLSTSRSLFKPGTESSGVHFLQKVSLITSCKVSLRLKSVLSTSFVSKSRTEPPGVNFSRNISSVDKDTIVRRKVALLVRA